MTERGPLPRDVRSDRWFRFIGWLGGWIVRLWGSTLSIDWIGLTEPREPGEQHRHVIWCFWHGHLLTLTYSHRNLGIVVLVSRHTDGEIISQIIDHLGYGVVRGSSTRGGLRALLEAVKAAKAGHPPAVTPDGPRGPIHELQSGVLHISQRSQVAIVPMAVNSVRRTRLKSWDRFLIPHPWSRVVIVVGDPIQVPAGIDAKTVEKEWGPRVTEGLRAVNARADEWRAERTGER